MISRAAADRGLRPPQSRTAVRLRLVRPPVCHNSVKENQLSDKQTYRFTLGALTLPRTAPHRRHRCVVKIAPTDGCATETYKFTLEAQTIPRTAPQRRHRCVVKIGSHAGCARETYRFTLEAPTVPRTTPQRRHRCVIKIGSTTAAREKRIDLRKER